MDLGRFFSARRIAVSGASPDHYFSDRLRENLEASKGLRILPVNPKRRKLWGLKAYRDLKALPVRPDLVIVITSARAAIETVRSMGELGLERAVVLASVTGKAIGRKLAAAASKVQVLGPESLGLMDVVAGRLLFCGRLTFPPPAGRVSIVSRSGGLLVECIRTLRSETRWGVRRAACCGREAGVSAGDVLESLAADSKTDAVILCVESDPAVASLAAPIGKLARAGKETILFSSAAAGLRDPEALGRGAGSAVFEGNALEALARTTGAFLARSMDEAAEAAAFVSSRPAGRGKRGSVFLVSVSAGVGEWMQSAARAAGLDVAPAGRALGRKLPGGIAPANPLDLSTTGVTDPAVLEKAVQACAAQKKIGAVMVGMHPPWGSTYSDRRNARWLSFLEKLGSTLVVAVQPTACLADPVNGLVRGLDPAARIVRWWTGPRASSKPRPPTDTDAGAARRILFGPARELSEPSSRRLLASYGLPFDPWHLAETPSQAAAKARSLGADACLRIASPDLAPDADLLRSPVRGDAACRDAWMDITAAARERNPDARILGVLVTMHRSTAPALFALTVSAGDVTPPLIACGAGGPGRQVARRYVLALCPLVRSTANELASEALALSGSQADPGGLAELLVRLSAFAWDFRDEVGVADLGEIVAVSGGTRCLGARVVIRRAVTEH